MDDYSSRRAAGGLGFSRRGSGISFRNQNHEDGSSQYCSRLGCSSRLNSMKGSQIDNQEKPRYARPSLRGSTTVSSSRTIFRKSLKEKQKQTFLGETDITESSGRQAELEYSESSNGVILSGELTSDVRQGETEDSLSISTREVTQTVMPDSDDFDSVSFEGSSTRRIELLAKSTASSSKPHKQRNKQLSVGDPDTCSTSFVRRSSASRNTGLAAKPSQGLGAPRCSLKNLSCTSISDVLPTGCSSADFSRSGRFNAVRRRTDGEIFPARGKGIIGSSSGGYSGSSHTNLDSGLPVAEKSIGQQAGRRSRNLTNNRDGAISVRARRPSNRGSSVRMSDQRDDSSFPLHEIHETVTIGPELQQTQYSLQEALPESISRSYSIELPQAFRSSRRAGSSSSTARSRSISRLDESSTQMFHGTLGDRDGYRRLNMEDIAEVLLALDRIEQDEELTYEQLLVLETNLLLGGLTFHDQHRDMRMDIDNMSYEELLALEEKMGTVSTALSDEELAKCITRSIHMSASFSPEITSHILDDTKCSICQEEYDEGDEVGKLGCEHQYHLSCIYQWLRQKNWCPICKASVASSSK